jgi:foldase protein PrsA
VRKFLLLVFAVLAVTACSGGDKTVATVNGSQIDLAAVQALAPSDATVDTATFDGNLQNLIFEKVVSQAAEQEWGLTFDESAIDDQYNQILSSIGADDAAIDQYLSDRGYTRETVRHAAIQQLLSTGIADKLSSQVTDPTDEELQAAYEDAKLTQSQVCVHHILVATEQEANDVIDRLNAGESFEDVAKEVSTDTNSGQNGGDLGCAAPSAYVPEFAQATLDAPIGEVYGPVQTDYGYHVLIVDSRDVPTFDDLKPQLEEQVKQDKISQLFTDWLTGKLDAASIEIDPKYGAWAGGPTYQVNPPA